MDDLETTRAQYDRQLEQALQQNLTRTYVVATWAGSSAMLTIIECRPAGFAAAMMRELDINVNDTLRSQRYGAASLDADDRIVITGSSERLKELACNNYHAVLRIKEDVLV